jgi:DNA-binding LacI/PurR family transcriptional regulator
LPFSTVGRCEQRPAASFIAADGEEAGLLATRHLLELGHRRVGMVSSTLDPATCAERVAGYRRALAEAGIPLDPALVAEAPYTPGGGAQAMDLILSREPRVSAVVTISNTLAVEALQSLAAHRLRVPQDVAVVTFDDTWLSLVTTPPLTSVRTPLFEMGRRSVELLLAAIADRSLPPPRVVCPVSLVARGSTLGGQP